MNAATFSRTALGRAMLHATCLCRQPRRARFFLSGVLRNLNEWHRRAPWRLSP